jgi:hypothetical protein
MQFTHSSKAPDFFNPCAYKVKNWFQNLLSFQIQLVPLHLGREAGLVDDERWNMFTVGGCTS